MISTGLAALAGVVTLLGVVLLISGTRFGAENRRATRNSTHLWITHVDKEGHGGGRLSAIRIALGIAGGVVAALVTGWPVLILVVPLAVVVLPALLSRPPNPDLLLLQALDRWVRGLIAVLPTGKSVADAIRVTLRQAPPILAGPLAMLVVRLDERWPMDQALVAMADELASPDSDAVIAALILSAQRGGTGATMTLTALADSIQERIRALREIETERSKPRVVVRQVTLITLVVMAAAFLFGRDFFAPYGTPIGQLLLGGLLSLYLGSLFILRRLAQARPRERILRGVTL